jgi:hypothetical protein
LKNKSICKVKSCINFDRYCRIHPEGSLKKKKSIAPRSKKLAETMKKKYVPQVKEMVKKNTDCSIKSPVCTGKAQGYHHPEGRGINLLKKKRPCCNPCNEFLEQNDAWARAHGFKSSRHSPENNKLSGLSKINH